VVVRPVFCAALVVAIPAAAEPRVPGVLAIDRDVATVDASYEHSDHRDGLAVAPGGRLAIGDGGFLDGEVPIGWVDQIGHASLGNFTATIGLLRDGYLSAVALRLSTPTSPSAGPSATAITSLAAPRVGDPELFLAGVTSVEALADGKLALGTWRLQAEFGVAGRWELEHHSYAVLRATLGAGASVTPFLDVAGSFITRSFVFDDSAPESFVYALALATVVHTRCWELAARLEVPFDPSARADNRFLVGIELRLSP
jgi:hypothetical protein